MRAATLLSLRPLFLDRSTIPDIFCGQYEEALSLVVRSVAFASFGFDANSRLCKLQCVRFRPPSCRLAVRPYIWHLSRRMALALCGCWCRWPRILDWIRFNKGL